MSDPKPEPKAGDPCPQCGDDFIEHRAPTDLERKFAEDKEHARPYPPRVDTATTEQRAELGPLYECRGCGYRTRIKPTLEEQTVARDKKTRGAAKPAAAGSSRE